MSARAREGRRPTPIVSRGFRATRACDRVPRGGRTISATALDARRRERAGRTARREARRGARRPNAVRRAAETCAVERASDMESGAGGEKPSRPTAVARAGPRTPKTGRAPRATPRGPFYFPRARFRCSVTPRPETRFVRGAFPTRRARASAASHRLALPPPSPRVRRHAPRPRRAPRRRRRRRRERRRRGLEALVGVARDQAGGLERRRARPRQRRERRRRERIRREPLQRGLVDATRYATRTRLGRKSSPFAATEARLRAPRERIRAESTHHASSASPLIHLGPAPNAIVSLPPPLSRSQSSASEPTAPDGPRIIPPPRRPRRAPRRALRDSRLIAAAATPPRPSPPAEAAAPRPTTISFPLARTLGSRSR